MLGFSCLFWNLWSKSLLKPGITHLHHLWFFSSFWEKKINILTCCIGDIKVGCISFRVVNFTALQQIKHMDDLKSFVRNLFQRMERGRPIRPAQLRQWRCDWMLLLSITFAPESLQGPTGSLPSRPQFLDALLAGDPGLLIPLQTQISSTEQKSAWLSLKDISFNRK